MERLLEYVTLYETLKRVKVVRNKKPVIKFQSDKEGYKVQQVNGRPKEVKMKPQEIFKRKKSARIAARKSKSKKGAANRKRALSMKRRTW